MLIGSLLPTLALSTAEVVTLAWAMVFVLLVTVVAAAPVTVYWGRPSGGAGVPMSRASRVVFAATLWLMVGVIATVAVGFRYARWFIPMFLVAGLVTAVMSVIDKRRWQRDGE